MKTTFIAKEGDNAKFTIDYSADEFEDAVVRAYKRNRSRFQIDGFRKGKAPRKIIENYYGTDIFYDEAINDLLQKDYLKALNELKLEVIDSPDLKLSDIEKGKNVIATITVACFPEVDAKNYSGIKVDKIESKIGTAEVKDELKRIQKNNGRMEKVEGRKSEKDDTLIFDFKGSIDGKEFSGGSAENFELKLGSGQFIPGFEDQLIGKSAGDDVDVKVTFPEDYHEKSLAGKPALFKCKIHDIKHEVLPEIDDELASDVSEFETLDEYKKDIKEKLQKKADDTNTAMMKDQMLNAFLAANSVDTPAVMVENEIDSMLKEISQQLTYQGISIEQYKQYLGKSDKDMRDDAREEAKKRVDMRILLRSVIRHEGIEATEEDIEQELKKFGEQYGQDVDQVKKMLGEDNIRFFKEDIQTRKAVDMMFDSAKLVKPAKKD